MNNPQLKALEETCAITLSIIRTRRHIENWPTDNILGALRAMKTDLEVLSGLLEDAEDKKRIEPLISGAQQIVQDREHINLRKLADDYFFELQSCLVSLQVILDKKAKERMSAYEPNERLALKT